jgi:uncharacterized repeat protein (TIGR01451 family)
MKQLFHWLRPVAAGVVLIFAFPPSGHAAPHRLLSSHVPVAVASGRVQPTGNLAETNRLHLAIGLPLCNKPELDQFLKQLYDPDSPNYHHYLSVPQFTEKYGPSKVDYEAVRGFAKANGLIEIRTHPNRMLLQVDASVADIRRVFHVNLRTYNHPSENRQFYAPDTEPTLDLPIPVLHISGLDNYVLPHPVSHIVPVKKGRPHPSGGGTKPTAWSGTGPGGSYISADFRNAYAPGVTLNGAHQNAALLEYDGYFTSDIIAYEQLCGLPNVNLVNVPIDGGIVGPPGGGVGEVSLDIEMVMAMAPGISTIFVYESPGGPVNDILSRMATDNSAKQISSSWGFGGDATTDQLFQEFATQGQTFFQASGDTGAFIGTGPSGVSASSGGDPYIILVGGTELVMNGMGVSYESESVWGTGQYQPGANWGSSGGICTSYPIPAWQQGINMTTNHGSVAYRNSPDVALTADNIWVIAGEGSQTGASGGTSAAAPLWCGFNAMINQQAAIYSLPPDGFINPAVYAIGKGPIYGLCFHDCTVGNNTWPSFPTNFYAVPGYDLCTGWGTPTGSNIINLLVPPLSIPALFVVTNYISGGNGNGVVDFDECNNLTFLITNEGSATGTGIHGILSSTTPGAIVAQGTVSFPDLPPHTAAASITPFTLSTEPSFICGTPVDLVLVLKSDQAVQTNTVQLSSGILGTPAPFSNTRPMVVPENNFTGIFSPVTVSNLQSVGKITVSTVVQAQYDEGITLRLISPDGTTVLLSQVNGGQGADYGTSCSSTNTETTFDDAATVPITQGAAPFIGTFQPQEPLSVYYLASGTNLNGVWRLNVVDEFPGDAATLSCWTLNVTPYVCQDGGGQCPGAVLSLTMSASPNPVLVDSTLVYTMTVSNAGPSSADNIIVSQSLPPGIGFVTTSNYPVAVSQVGSNLEMNIGSLPVYGSATFSVVTIPIFSELATSVATVGSTEINPNPDNSTASVTVQVTLPTADLAVSMSASPPTVLQGGLVTFDIYVTNNGPFTATGVVLTNTLPANVNLVSATTSYPQASISADATLVDLGTLPTGTNAVIIITVSPTTTGNITDIAQVGLSPLETDPNLFNNTASATVTVGPSAALAVSAVITPTTIVSGANYTNVATVVNNGPSAANTIVFSETIPASSPYAATFVSSSQAGVIVTNGVITWNVGTLANGASLSITNVIKAPTLLAGVNSLTLPTTFTVFGQPGDVNTNNNVLTLQSLVEPPTITISPASVTLVSESLQPPNGAVNPGETVGVQFYLKNTGNVSTTNLVAALQDSGGVILASGSQTYGALAPGGPAVGAAYSFTANGTNGGTVVATLALQDGSANLGTVFFDFPMPVVQTFWNTNPISIPATQYTPEPDDGPASPYPSIIEISNVTGYVSKVTVTVSNMDHTYPADIGLLLVGPATNTVLMGSDGIGILYPGITNVTLTFDSTTALVLPYEGTFSSGTYAPASYNPTNFYSNAVAPPYATNLSSFIGLTPNGAWSLWARDMDPGDAGGISNGWAVTITTITPVNPTNSLAASIVASTNQLTLGSPVTFLLGVTNDGSVAVNGYLTNVLPAGLAFYSASVAQSSYTRNGQTIIYNLGLLAPGAGLTITNVDLSTNSGLQTNTITTGLPSQSFNTVINSATVVTAVNLPLADLAAGLTVTPDPGVLGSNLTYTLTTTNLGPSNALNTLGSFSLAGLNFVSAAPSQGTATNTTNGTVQCNLGTILPGNIATVVIIAAPQAVGLLTNTWSLSTSSLDTNPANNSVTALVKVNYLAPNIVAGGATLLIQGVNPPNGAINPDETVTVAFTLDNIGTSSTTNLLATLTNSGGILPITTNQVYGAIPAGGSAAQPYSFTALGVPGGTVTATLVLADGSNSLGSVSYSFLIPATTSYANPTGIIIPDVGTGTPYPSEILVSGLTNGPANLLVSKVTVTLNGFAHTFPHDVNVLLESPAGQELIVMGHAGGPYAATNLTLAFDDAATQSLPTGQLTNGTYRPTDYAPVDLFPGLAPASSADVLALFNGTNPNGIWSLYVYDDTPGNDGIIIGGWSLGLTAVNTVNPAALLAASMIHAPDPVMGGNYLNYQITVTNSGPDTATSVVITNTLPASVTLVGATPSQGSVTNAGDMVICNLGSISNGATATLTIEVVAGAPGTVVNTAVVSTASTDLYLAESTAVNSATVTPSAIYLKATNLASGLQLTLLGQAGQNYIIQTSSNLLVWKGVVTNTGSFIYTDSRTNAPQRFYRAVHPSQ